MTSKQQQQQGEQAAPSQCIARVLRVVLLPAAAALFCTSGVHQLVGGGVCCVPDSPLQNAVCWYKPWLR
jgi:hypothetical protein